MGPLMHCTREEGAKTAKRPRVERVGAIIYTPHTVDVRRQPQAPRRTYFS